MGASLKVAKICSPLQKEEENSTDEEIADSDNTNCGKCIIKGQHRIFNKETNEYEFKLWTLDFIKTKEKYKGKSIKRKIAKLLNMETSNIMVYFERFRVNLPLDDYTEYKPKFIKHCTIDHKIKFNIKYFYENDYHINDIHNGEDYEFFTFLNNYKLYEFNNFGQDELYDIITTQITENKIVYECLECDIVDENIKTHLLVIGYLNNNGFNDKYLPENIINLLIKMVILNRKINLRTDIISNNIKNNDTLILYKNFNHPYIEYDKIDSKQIITIYIQDIDGFTKRASHHVRSKTVFVDKKSMMKANRERARSVKAQSLHGIQGININHLEIDKNELKIGILDTVDDVCRKIKNEFDIKVKNNMMFGEYILRDRDRLIIDWGVINGSTIRLHNKFSTN